MTNQDEAKTGQFRDVTDSFLDRQTDYVKWTTTLVTAAIVWIGRDLPKIPSSYRGEAVFALVFLLLSLLSALVIGFAVVGWWKERQRKAKQELQLGAIGEAIDRGRAENEPIGPEFAAISREAYHDYRNINERLGRWFRLATSPWALAFHSGTLFIGVFLYGLAQFLIHLQ